MKLKRNKCFCLPHVEYLGHTMSEEGLRPSATKVKAITKTPQLSSFSELKSFLGLVNYYICQVYARFSHCPHFTLQLLKHSKSWQWNNKQQLYILCKNQRNADCTNTSCTFWWEQILDVSMWHITVWRSGSFFLRMSYM